MYKVYNIDACFDTYASYEVLVGGNSAEDIIDHLKDIFPDTVITIDEYSIDEYLEENPNYKVGDKVAYPYFEDNQIKEIKESLNCNWPRITEVPHMFTDTPYTILESFSHIE